MKSINIKKRKLIIVLGCLLMVACTSLNKREPYNNESSFFYKEEIPYFPTLTAPNTDIVNFRNNMGLITVIGIPYIIVDYTCSIVMDLFLLPADIYRNNFLLPRDEEWKKIQNQIEELREETKKKLKIAKTEDEKAEIISEFKKSVEEYTNQLMSIDSYYTETHKPSINL